MSIDVPPEYQECREIRLPCEDNWKHRNTNMRCRTCMFFVTKPSFSSKGAIGRCRRHAPTMQGFPVVFPTDWCGDHKLDEEKQ